MIYIKLKIEEEKEYKNIFLKFINKYIKKIKCRFENIIEEKYEDKTLIIIKSTQNRTLNKLSKYIKEKCVNRVCLSNNLLDNNVFMEFIKNENVKIFDGKWLFKHLLINSAEYVAINKKEKLEYQEISILTNEINPIIVYNIKEIANKIRILNIITNCESKFRKLEKELYEQKGIILNMNNNYRKSLIKSDIIFNFDFSEDEINQYSLPKNAVIINFKDIIKINSKAFEGINANFCEIPIPRKYFNYLIYFKDFDATILYESFIYNNTMPQNIVKQIDEDKINIVFLIGQNGKIRKKEYLKLSKKMAN